MSTTVAQQNDVFGYIERDADVFVEQLRKLCRQPSVSAQNLGLDEAAQLVQKLLSGTGFENELFHPTKGPAVIFAELKSKTGGKTLVLYNHYDVQPADPVELWTNSPFSAVLENGRVYARGASDNKGNIVSRLLAINAFLKSRSDSTVHLKWIVQADDEIGSPH